MLTKHILLLFFIKFVFGGLLPSNPLSSLKNPINFFNNSITKIDVLDIHNKINGLTGNISDQFFGNETFSQVCYGVLGCFGRMDFYSPLNRPVALLPQSPEKMEIKLNLFTEKNKFIAKVFSFDLKLEDLENSNFDPKKPTKFIVHGFQSSFDDMQWMGDIKDLIFLLDDSRFNVFAVDWSKGASSFFYNQAAANTRVVGSAVAYFIKKLVEYKGIDLANVHLIGHSLGAHVSGYVGKKFENPRIGRITGLDPAGPAFQKENPHSRLDKSDALYVEILHTDAGDMFVEGLGLKDCIGDEDFFPNGGTQQPGCGLTKGAFNVLEYGAAEGISSTIACNHARSWQMILVNPQTTEENCQFVGYECGSYSDFLAGKCADCGEDGTKCSLFNMMGEYDPISGEFYKKQELRGHTSIPTTTEGPGRKLFFSTSEEKPYCLHHYRIAIYFDEEMQRSATGSITLNLVGTRRSVDNIELSQNFDTFSAGKVATTLITFSKTLGAVHHIDFKFKFGGVQVIDPTRLLFTPKLKVKKIEVNYLSNINPKEREKFSTVLCPAIGSDVSSGDHTVFEKCPT